MSAGREFPTGDSDSGGLPLTNSDGTAIDWLGAAVFTMGVLAAEFFDGVARFVATAWNAWLIEPMAGLSAWGQRLLGELLGTPNTLVAVSFGGTERWLANNGLVSIVIGIGIVVVIAFLASRVIPRG